MKRYLVFCATFFLISSAFSQAYNTSQVKGYRDSLKKVLNNDSSKNIYAHFATLANLSSGASNEKSKRDVGTYFSRKGNVLLINKNSSPYQTHLVTDGLVITAAVATTLAGYSLIENKNDLTPAELATKTKDKLPFFDRGIAGNYSTQANKDSYILFDASYAIPVAMIFINKNERKKAGQLITLYVETIGITGAMYTLTAGLVYRSRPFVYGDKTPLDKRLDKGGQRSFYGGHVATTAAATFLTAKIFSDFNPDSKLRPYLWAASGILTASMAYMRMQAGYHFFSDCVLSAAIGTATGILIPSLHKNKSFEKVSMAPEMINGNAGMHLSYHF